MAAVTLVLDASLTEHEDGDKSLTFASGAYNQFDLQ